MNLEEKLKLFKEKGWTYNKDTGEVYSHLGNLVGGNKDYIFCSLYFGKKTINVGAHQLGWYLATGEVPNVIDHINHNKRDNRLINLRSVGFQQNLFNTKAKGCYWHKRNKKWCSQIMLNGKGSFLGLFDTEEEAHIAYLEAKKIYHTI